MVETRTAVSRQARHRLSSSTCQIARLLVILGPPLLLAGTSSSLPQPYSTWSDYAGSADSAQYSALARINKSNVNRLDLVWFYPVPDHKNQMEFNPLIVGDVMYVLGQNNAVVALDAASGKPIWSHHFETDLNDTRGVSYWRSKDGSDRRLIIELGDYIRELDARTGKTIEAFGDGGRVNMRAGGSRRLGYASATPGRVFENLILVGSGIGDVIADTRWNWPPGDVRAYDVITGKLVWTFHTIPHPGEFGYDTWPKDAWTRVGGANVWGEISIDEKRGIAYFPVASPRYNFYGGDRAGANLFGDSLLALDARTGKRLWHFQAVHHDLWDYDLTTGPKLLTVRHNGKMVDIVAEPTKFGFLYVFDRVTGEPLWPIEERPVPQSDVPGEKTSPTQPFPTYPPPFARQKVTMNDLNPYMSEADRARIKDMLKKARNEGLFTPPGMGRESIEMPSDAGGSNWGGAAADPQTGMLYVRSSDAPVMHGASEWPPVETTRQALSGYLHGMLRHVSDLRSSEARPERRGYAVFARQCAGCHGMDRAGIPSPAKLGMENFRNVVRAGWGSMPGFSEAAIPSQDLNTLAAYLTNPAASGQPVTSAVKGVLPPPPGQKRYIASWFELSTRDGMPAVAPPWAELTAYDLNNGTIKWKAPLGTVPGLAAKGITNTGSSLTRRNGPVVTAGGLIFVGSWPDKTVHAYDKDNGKVLWQKSLDGNPEGTPAVYQTGGRQFVVFGARGLAGADDSGQPNMAFLPGKAAGYYAFALPGPVKAAKK